MSSLATQTVFNTLLLLKHTVCPNTMTSELYAYFTYLDLMCVLINMFLIGHRGEHYALYLAQDIKQ